jgi:hypothetical protein
MPVSSPVGDDAVLDRVLEGEDSSLRLRLVADICVLLAMPTMTPLWRGRPTIDGKTARGASSPAKPACRGGEKRVRRRYERRGVQRERRGEHTSATRGGCAVMAARAPVGRVGRLGAGGAEARRWGTRSYAPAADRASSYAASRGEQLGADAIGALRVCWRMVGRSAGAPATSPRAPCACVCCVCRMRGSYLAHAGAVVHHERLHITTVGHVGGGNRR